MIYFWKNRAAGRDVGFLDDDGIGGGLGLERNRIAAAGHADRLRVDGRSAVLADDAGGAFVEADRTADLAGIEHGGDLAVGLLVEPEADVDAVFAGAVEVDVAVRDLLQWDGGLRRSANAISVAFCESAEALGVDELGRHQHDEQERTDVDRAHPQPLAARASTALCGARQAWSLPAPAGATSPRTAPSGPPARRS